MLFSDSVEHVTMHKGVLAGECKKSDNKTTIQSSISLNDYIGNVDGVLTWGGRGFSHSVETAQIVKGVLSAKLKNNAGKVVESKLDLNEHIQNVDGILGVIPITVKAADVKQVDVLKASAAALDRTESSSSTASASAMFSSASAATASSSISSSSIAQSSASYSSSSYFSSSHFNATSKIFSIEETCSKLEIRDRTHLHADCRCVDGSIKHSSIDLNEIIGFAGGHLVWDGKHFRDHVFEICLESFVLVVKYYHDQGKHNHDNKHYHIERIDLRERLRNHDGVLILLESTKKLSILLSEVPWMKFKVIAEPDLSVFARDAVMQETLGFIAETTVKHVTLEMHERLTAAMEIAIKLVTDSAMSHVRAEMEKLVSGAVGHASASASITAAEHLHLFGGAYGAHLRGFGAGYGYANGHLHSEQHEHHVLRDGHTYAEVAQHAQVAHT